MNEPDFIQPRPFTSPARAPDPAGGGKRPPFNFLQLIIAIAAIGMLAGVGIMLSRPGDNPAAPPVPATPPTAPAPVKPAPTPPVAPLKTPAVEAAVSPPVAPAPVAPALSPAAQEQARKDADAAMSDLLDARRKIEAMAPSAWGGVA